MTVPPRGDLMSIIAAYPPAVRTDIRAGAAAPDLRSRSLRATLSADQRLGRAFVRGTIAGTLLVFLFCGGVSLWAGLALGPAIGIGAFTAFWGGPGFGGMMGATVYFSNHLDDF
jgi:hypothetical protein